MLRCRTKFCALLAANEYANGRCEPNCVVDLGGGSGRLLERVLERFANAQAVLVDQSAAFLAIAERRLARFGERVTLIEKRLQDDWRAELPATPDALVSMSAIHHLEPAEKQALYRTLSRCARAEWIVSQRRRVAAGERRRVFGDDGVVVRAEGRRHVGGADSRVVPADVRGVARSQHHDDSASRRRAATTAMKRPRCRKNTCERPGSATSAWRGANSCGEFYSAGVSRCGGDLSSASNFNSAMGSTGFTRCMSKPDCCDWRRSSS